jgi:hypothetical protein
MLVVSAWVVLAWVVSAWVGQLPWVVWQVLQVSRA